ncbi:MAG: hypothetical protein EHM33_28165 [Chloroflexi bacterium]|nr:MAG: hypothetical protein EHM33_28165 [Chloroflexota bacterium]
MTAEEFFLTLRPEPRKQGARIEKAKYDVMRNAILENLRAHGALSFTRLGNLVEEQLLKKFDGSVMWYYTTVKLDMEARGEIRRTPSSEPELIELV